MNDLKITFPKLKALSERNTVKTFKIISNTVKTAVENRSQRAEMTPLEEKLNAIKYQYVNKYMCLHAGAHTTSRHGTGRFKSTSPSKRQARP